LSVRVLDGELCYVVTDLRDRIGADAAHALMDREMERAREQRRKRKGM